MMFKTLVECLIQRQRDPDDTLALNALNSLTRELQNDLIQAFERSEPLVDRHPSLFWESRSYLDFLMKLSKLPLETDYYARQRKKGVRDLEKGTQTMRNDEKDPLDEVTTYREENGRLSGALERCQGEITRLSVALKQCQEEKAHFVHERATGRKPDPCAQLTQEKGTFTDAWEACPQEKADWVKQRERSQKENATLVEQLAKSQQETTALAHQWEACEQEKADWREKWETSEREKEALADKVAKSQQETTRLEQQWKTCQREKARWEEKVKTHQQEHADLVEKMQTCQQEKAELIDQWEACQQEKAELVDQWKTYQEETVPSVHTLEAFRKEKETLSCTLEKYVKDQATLNQVLEKCQKEKGTVVDQLATCQTEKGDLSDELETCQEENDTLRGNLKKSQRENDTLRGDLKTCQRKNDTLRGDLKKGQLKNDILHDDLKICQRENDTLQADLKACQKEKAALQKVLDTRQEEKGTLAEKLARGETEIDLLRHMRAKNETEIDTLHDALEKCQKEKGALQDALATHQKDKSSFHDDLAACQQEKATLSHQLDTCQKEKGALVNALATYQTEKGALRDDLNTCQQEKASYSVALETCQQEKASYRDALEKSRCAQESLSGDLKKAQELNDALSQQVRVLTESCQAASQAILSSPPMEVGLTLNPEMMGHLSRYIERNERFMEILLQQYHYLTPWDQVVMDKYKELQDVAQVLSTDNAHIRSALDALTQEHADRPSTTYAFFQHLRTATTELPIFEEPKAGEHFWKSSLEWLESETEEQRRQLSQYEAQVQELENQLQEVTTRLKGCDQDKQLYLEQLKSLKDTNEELIRHERELLVKCEAQVQQLESQLQKVKDLLGRCEKDTQQYSEELKSLKEENEEIIQNERALLATCEAQVQTLETQLQNVKNLLGRCEKDKQNYVEQLNRVRKETDEEIVKNERRLLQKFQKQLERIKTEAQCHVTVDTFVDVVLDLYRKVPEKLSYLDEIAHAASLPIDKSFVSEMERRLQAYPFVQNLHSSFAPQPLDDWMKHFPLRLEELRRAVLAVVPKETNWLQYSMDQIGKVQSQDAFIEEVMKLAPDLIAEAAMKRGEWKKLFAQRYTMLLESVRALIGFQAVNTLSSALQEVRTHLLNPEVSSKPNWLMEYIQWLETENKKNGLLQQSIKSYENLERECEKLVKVFDIPFKKETLYSDITSSVWIKRCVKHSEIFLRLETYFSVINLSAETIPNKIDHLFQSVMQVLPNEPNKHHFESHFKSYWRAWISHHPDTYYVQWLKEFNLPQETPKEIFLMTLKTLKCNEWETLYSQWLKELGLEASTPKEDFSAYLKRRSREKRSVSAVRAEEYSVGSEKKLRLQEDWTYYEMQNVFMAFYKEYFLLKWNHVNRFLPNDANLMLQIERKLRVLEKMTLTLRQSDLLDIYTKYVHLDLALLSKKTTYFTEIVSISAMLKASMQETEKYLEELVRGQTGETPMHE